MKYFISLVFLLSGFYSNGQSSIPTDHYCFLSFDKGEYSGLDKKSVPATLNDSDFVTLELVLSDCICKYNREQTAGFKERIRKFPNDSLKLDEFTIDLNEYYRQYMVVRNRKGEKEVWINCLCEVQYVKDWTKRVIQVMDGGKCYFSIKINLKKKSYSHFMVNGIA